MNAGNPVGRTFGMAARPNQPAPQFQIVGLAADAVYRSLRDPVPPTIYVAIAQREQQVFNRSSIVLSIRSAAGSPARLTNEVVASVGGINSDLQLRFRLLASQVDGMLIQERLMAMLSAFFGLLALLLAGLGLYGVTAYAVTRRRTEIGIRMALGAAPAGVVRLILQRVALLVGAGVAIGAIASLWASRFVGALLFGMQPHDPATLTGAAVVLALVGGFAGWLPAHRASRFDPAHVLRDS